MNCYPVFIPTLNRFSHFKRCVESLAKNPYAVNTELIIGLDYPPTPKYEEGYKEIKTYISSISGFKNVHVIEREVNYGAEKNWNELESYCLSKYGAAIGTEDDNEFSPCFLEFMNKALYKYKENENVTSVTGYNSEFLYSCTDKNIFFLPSGGAWGIGLWKEKQDKFYKTPDKFYSDILKSWSKTIKLFRIEPAILGMLINMIRKGRDLGDVKTFCYNVFTGGCQIKPRISMVRNWGHDGSGVHCNVTNTFISQRIETALSFELDDIEVYIDNNIKKKLFYNLLPTNKMLALLYAGKIMIKYLLYRGELLFKQ